MEIILQKNSSEFNRFNKNLTDIATVEVTIKDSTSIIDPVLTLTGAVDLKNCNYLTIPSFNRSYFINNIKSIRANVWEIECHVDVLYSFKDAILSNEAIISKQENKWNLYLDDGTFKAYQNPIIVTKEFPSGFSTPEFVLALTGNV